MKRPPVLRHASLMRVASDKEMPVATTMPNVLRNSAESSPVCSLMGTYLHREDDYSSRVPPCHATVHSWDGVMPEIPPPR